MREFAEQIAIEAGAELSRRFRHVQTYEIKANYKGFVTEADLASEKLVKKMISEKFPTHLILAEESGFSRQLDKSKVEPMWFIDPLDGTNNFAHGNPYHCVSIAFGNSSGEIEASAVYQPFNKLMFSAERGRGAFCNGEKIRLPTAQKKFEEGAYATGWASAHDKELDEICANIMRVQKSCTSTAVRMNGAAALDLALTAWGTFDGFWERHLNPWDTAAGGLIVSEAGGLLQNEKGEAFNCLRDPFVIAGHPSVVSRLLELVSRK